MRPAHQQKVHCCSTASWRGTKEGCRCCPDQGEKRPKDQRIERNRTEKPYSIWRKISVMYSDFLERHIKIKSYQPFWCWNFLITHEFGQIFSSFALKICCSVKSWGYQTENDIFLDIMAFIWIKLSISTLKGMETLKIPVNNLIFQDQIHQALK